MTVTEEKNGDPLTAYTQLPDGCHYKIGGKISK